MNTTTRSDLNIFNDYAAVVAQMSEGNPGALDAMMQAIRQIETPSLVCEFLLSLDDMNMRGQQIYVAYSDYSGRDAMKFVENAVLRDPEMVAKVNRECAYHSEYGSFLHKAVTAGGSSNRQMFTPEETQELRK